MYAVAKAHTLGTLPSFTYSLLS